MKLGKHPSQDCWELTDTIEIRGIDICHKKTFRKMQTCKGVQRIKLAWLASFCFILEKTSQNGTLKQIIAASMLLRM